MNSPTAHACMGDFGIRTHAQFDSLNHATRLSQSVSGGKIADIDIYYLLRLEQASAPLMGAVSLTQRSKVGPPDIGWCILEPFMGQGYAAKAGERLLRMVKESLGITNVIAWPGVNNERSKRVAEKIGLVLDREVEDGNGGMNAVYVLPGMVFDMDIALSLWGEDHTETDI
ncbi:MAG: hypothetical protein Q9224_003148 [Gallowayella concinna]